MDSTGTAGQGFPLPKYHGLPIGQPRGVFDEDLWPRFNRPIKDGLSAALLSYGLRYVCI
jgi:hypothetical protein